MMRKSVPEYEGLYSADENGNIYSERKKRYMKPGYYEGYASLTFCVNKVQKTVKVHRIIAETFLLNPENKPEVNHLDGNPSNNKVSNLEWSTHAENLLHATHILKTVSPPDNRGERCGQAKLTEDQVKEIWNLRKSGRSYPKIGKQFGISHSEAQLICNGTNWKHLGLEPLPSRPQIGEFNPRSKLTNEKILEIRKDRAEGFSEPKIAKKFGISNSSVHRICVGDTWKHLPLHPQRDEKQCQ